MKLLAKNTHLSRDLGDDGEGLMGSIVENFPDIIHSVDDEGRFVFLNKIALTLLEYSKEELIGTSVFDIYADDVLEDAKEGFRILKKKGIIDRVESKLKSKSGEIIDVELRSFSIYDDKGNFLQTFTIIRDMRDLIRFKGKLIEQSKLAGVGELASGVLHDIRQPLDLIATYGGAHLKAALLEKNWDSVKDCQKMIDDSCGKILYLAEHLTKYAEKDNGLFESISLQKVISNSLLLLSHKINESEAIIVDETVYKNISLDGDYQQIEQFFINLIGNACDAVTDLPRKKVTINCTEIGDNVEIAIADSGNGIADEDLDKVFQPFFTTKKKGMGTGLGLTIAKKIVEGHGGSIRVVSKVGSGTTIYCLMPKVRK